MFKNEPGRWLAKGQKSGSGDLSMIYRVSSKKLLLPEMNLDKTNLLLIPSLGQPCRPEIKVTGF